MLVLAGNPNLNHDIVFTVQSSDNSQYLASISYDTYNEQGWSASATDALPIKANQNYQNGAVFTRALQQKSRCKRAGRAESLSFWRLTTCFIESASQCAPESSNG